MKKPPEMEAHFEESAALKASEVCVPGELTEALCERAHSQGTSACGKLPEYGCKLLILKMKENLQNS
jgi:hypothetical protein